MIVLFIVGAILILFAAFDIPIWAVIIGVAALLIIFAVIGIAEARHQQKIADSIVKATKTEEIAVYKKKTEHTGYSLSRGERRDNYEYKDVLDHYECVFSVKYKSGQSGVVKCRKDSLLYAELLRK